jgi:membrane protein implicated in regulation of membrane protease activity
MFIVFGALSTFVAYEQLDIQYGSSAPASYILLTSLNVMLPLLLYAVLSFVVAVFSSRLAKETDKKEANAGAEAAV